MPVELVSVALVATAMRSFTFRRRSSTLSSSAKDTSLFAESLVEVTRLPPSDRLFIEDL